MLTADNLQHMLSVARKCYKLARAGDYSEEDARDVFLMGLLHDIGKEFNHDNHALTSYEMLKHFTESENFEFYLNSIELHGQACEKCSTFQDMLNYADMTTMPDGSPTSLDNRLSEIKERYGSDSDVYHECVKLSYYLKSILEEN